MRCAFACLMVLLCAAAARGQQPEAVSLLGKPLVPPALGGDDRRAVEADIARARATLEKDPGNADAMLALGRATAHLGRITEALEIFTRAIEVHEDDGRLYLERGRDFIVIRKFDVGERDARKALETIPDAACTVGLALYLKGDFGPAKDAYVKCPDPGIFLYLSDKRAGGSSIPRPAVPAETVRPSGTGIRLPGSVAPRAEKTRAPMSAAYLDAAARTAVNTPARRPAGTTDPAEDLLKQIVEKNGDRWMEPVYIAAEADYARILKAEGKFKKLRNKK